MAVLLYGPSVSFIIELLCHVKFYMEEDSASMIYKGCWALLMGEEGDRKFASGLSMQYPFYSISATDQLASDQQWNTLLLMPSPHPKPSHLPTSH